jgi:hypothetical protein
MDGKVISKEEMFIESSWSWSEGIWHQYAQKHAYGYGAFNANFHEVSISLF